MARWETVYGEGRGVHLGSLDRQVEREAAHQSAQGLVPQPRRGDRERRLRGHLSVEAATALVCRLARLRVLAGLSLSRAAAGHALPSDRHRTLQIRRIQTERVDQGS